MQGRWLFYGAPEFDAGKRGLALLRGLIYCCLSYVSDYSVKSKLETLKVRELIENHSIGRVSVFNRVSVR